MEPISDGVRAGLFAGGIAACLLLEGLFPLRPATQPKTRRVVLNLAFAAVNSLFVRFTFLRVVYLVSAWVAAREVGLLYRVDLPWAARVVVGLLLMDYTFYFWHVWNHRVPFLWRFHNVHHVDLDLDVTTAARFHAGELILSVPFRSAQLVVFGIDPFTWILFEVLVVASTQFHHANIRLPERLEAVLNRFIVTPRMHGLHHSLVGDETNSNFSTIFSFWDRLHRSLIWGRPPFAIGVPSYRDPGELTLLNLLVLPFRAPRPWRLPDGGLPSRESACNLR